MNRNSTIKNRYILRGVEEGTEGYVIEDSVLLEKENCSAETINTWYSILEKYGKVEEGILGVTNGKSNPIEYTKDYFGKGGRACTRVENLYKLLSKEEGDLLRKYYLWYTKRLFSNSEQVLERKTKYAKKEEKFKELREAGGIWEYAGMIDWGEVQDTCTMNHPLRYVHIAWNIEEQDMTTGFFGEDTDGNKVLTLEEALDEPYIIKFGSVCVGDFFEVDQDCVNELKRVQQYAEKDMQLLEALYRTDNKESGSELCKELDKIVRELKRNILKKQLRGASLQGLDPEMVNMYLRFRDVGMLPPHSLVKELAGQIQKQSENKYSLKSFKDGFGYTGGLTKIKGTVLEELLKLNNVSIDDVKTRVGPSYINTIYFKSSLPLEQMTTAVIQYLRMVGLYGCYIHTGALKALQLQDYPTVDVIGGTSGEIKGEYRNVIWNKKNLESIGLDVSLDTLELLVRLMRVSQKMYKDTTKLIITRVLAEDYKDIRAKDIEGFKSHDMWLKDKWLKNITKEEEERLLEISQSHVDYGLLRKYLDTEEAITTEKMGTRVNLRLNSMVYLTASIDFTKLREEAEKKEPGKPLAEALLSLVKSLEEETKEYEEILSKSGLSGLTEKELEVKYIEEMGEVLAKKDEADYKVKQALEEEKRKEEEAKEAERLKIEQEEEARREEERKVKEEAELKYYGNIAQNYLVNREDFTYREKEDLITALYKGKLLGFTFPEELIKEDAFIVKVLRTNTTKRVGQYATPNQQKYYTKFYEEGLNGKHTFVDDEKENPIQRIQKKYADVEVSDVEGLYKAYKEDETSLSNAQIVSMLKGLHKGLIEGVSLVDIVEDPKTKGLNILNTLIKRDMTPSERQESAVITFYKEQLLGKL